MSWFFGKLSSTIYREFRNHITWTLKFDSNLSRKALIIKYVHFEELTNSYKNGGFLRKIQKMHFPPQNWLNRKTSGTIRKCSSRAFQWMVMSVCSDNLKFFWQFLCPALGDHQSKSQRWGISSETWTYFWSKQVYRLVKLWIVIDSPATEVITRARLAIREQWKSLADSSCKRQWHRSQYQP
jgi:hypothetical protein